jgi:hypothetical protein
MSRRRSSSLRCENVRTSLFDTNENSNEASESSSTMTNSDKSASSSQRTENDVDEFALNSAPSSQNISSQSSIGSEKEDIVI